MADEEKKQKKSQDLRTFGIAFVTAILVVALYHLGCGLYKIYFPSYETQAPAYACMGGGQLYMLVPCGGGECGEEMPPHHGDRPGKEFRRTRKPMGKGAMREHGRKGMRARMAKGDAPDHPKAPKAPKAPAPAPAPVPAAEAPAAE